MDLAQTHPKLTAWDWQGLRRRGLLEAHRILRSQDDAEEVVQDAMLRAWRARDSCSQPHMPAPWVMSIVRNEALRRVSGRPIMYFDDMTFTEAPSADAGDDVLRTIDVGRALGQLGDVDRALVQQRYGADLTVGKLAETFGMPEGTVKVRLHRARKRLRAVLKEHE